MPAVAGSKKGKKTAEAKAASVEEKDDVQVRHFVTKTWWRTCDDVSNK